MPGRCPRRRAGTVVSSRQDIAHGDAIALLEEILGGDPSVGHGRNEGPEEVGDAVTVGPERIREAVEPAVRVVQRRDVAIASPSLRRPTAVAMVVA